VAYFGGRFYNNENHTLFASNRLGSTGFKYHMSTPLKVVRKSAMAEDYSHVWWYNCA